jgi:manganese/iron transport system substrate-binding protein
VFSKELLVYNENDNQFHLQDSGMTPLAKKTILMAVLVFSVLICACSTPPAEEESSPLKVVATTTIVGDIVSQVGGDLIDVEVLLPPGSDPHSFQPAPKDLVSVAEADVVFANGAGLEEFLQPLIQNAGGKAQVIDVSEGIRLLESQEVHSGEETDDHLSGDPHTWFDPANVETWTTQIEQALSAADPENTSAFEANAQVYREKLLELDAWIEQQVALIPLENRKLFTDHASFTYFANRYGFEQVGAVIPGYSTLAEPSARDLAAIEAAIRRLGVKTIFTSVTASPALVERVAQDTGARLVRLYNGSLSEADGPAATYLDFMRYNVEAMVEALR